MWQIYSDNAASRFRTKPSATGVRHSDSTTPGSCSADEGIVTLRSQSFWMIGPASNKNVIDSRQTSSLGLSGATFVAISVFEMLRTAGRHSHP